MTYTLIGSGNMAWLIASRMLAAGHTCVGAWARNRTALRELSKAFILPVADELHDLHDGTDVCIIAVADNAIAEVASQLHYKTTVLIHTAGSVNINVLTGTAAHAAVVWPILSVRKNALPTHRDFWTAIEGSTNQAFICAERVASAISDHAQTADSATRQHLHLAAVVGNNFVNYLLTICASVCAECNMPIEVLEPLLAQPLRDLRSGQAKGSQTGPARRHDDATMQMQLLMLSARPEWQGVYAAISKAIMSDFPQGAIG